MGENCLMWLTYVPFTTMFLGFTYNLSLKLCPKCFKPSNPFKKRIHLLSTSLYRSFVKVFKKSNDFRKSDEIK